MKPLLSVLSVLSTLLVSFTLICGFWLKNPNVELWAGATGFHTGLGVAAGICVLATAVLTLIRK